METLLQDVRYAFRALLRNPGFASTAIVILALGIAANATIFTTISALFLRPVPADRPDELVDVYTRTATPAGPAGRWRLSSFLDFLSLRDTAGVFSGAAAYLDVRLTTGGVAGDPEILHGIMVTSSYFGVLGVQPALGRGFLPEDDLPGARPVVVISHAYWKNALSSDPAVLGRTITLNSRPFTVVGVAPPGFAGTRVSEAAPSSFWLPMAMQPVALPGADLLASRGSRWIEIIARLEPGVSPSSAQAALDVLSASIRKDSPETSAEIALALSPASRLEMQTRGEASGILGLLQAAVGLVLAISCANVSGLLLARAAGRRQEIAVRMSLGAARARLVKQLLTEGVVLSVLAGTAGVVLALWGTDVLSRLAPPLAFDLRLDVRALAFTMVVSLVTGILTSLAPALQATRDVLPSLKDRSAPLSSRSPLRNVLASSQIALSLVLLVSAGLFLRSVVKAQSIDPGFDASKLLVVSADPSLLGYAESRSRETYARIGDRLSSLPGVLSVALTDTVPLGNRMIGTGVQIEGREPPSDENPSIVYRSLVSPGYFSATGVKILSGRAIEAADREGSPGVLVINETMARRFWPGEDPLGKRLRFDTDDWRTVIGVAADSKYHKLAEDPTSYMYAPWLQSASGAPAATPMSLLLRTEGDLSSLALSARKEIAAIEASIPLTGVRPASDLVVDADQRRFIASLLTVLGALAALLASIGLYGLISYAVGRRTREIGIRIALGARGSDVLRLVVRQGMGVVAAGIGAGLVISFAATRLFRSMLFGVTPTDLLTFVGLAILLCVAGAAACWFPALRASRVSPSVALRYE